MNKFTCLIFILSLSTACTEYWWTRGQPPSVATQLSKAEEKLSNAIAERGDERKNIRDISNKIRSSLNQALAKVEKKQNPEKDLAATKKSFMSLEGKIAVTSRAPYGELSGQLRAFDKANKNGKMPEYRALGLFTARTLSFLASELSVSAPV